MTVCLHGVPLEEGNLEVWTANPGSDQQQRGEVVIISK
jgi:hypothetical protein